jgi:dienelactone hydrolase
MLAARGYPVLALAYFREDGLPRELVRIPLEYFRRALLWMRTRPEVDPARVVTLGISRGGELSLILASTFPDLVSGAIAMWERMSHCPRPSTATWRRGRIAASRFSPRSR